MILGADRPAVIENIRKNVEAGQLNAKGELDDPVVSDEERMQLISDFLEKEKEPKAKKRHALARNAINYYGKMVNRKTVIEGMDKIAAIQGAAIITSNHFNQLDQTVIRKLIDEKDSRKIWTVIEETNLAMPGFFGFLMNNGDNIPISINYDYMRGAFLEQLQKVIDDQDYILIYPEQEMWFNYRKPRPCMRGAYYYASKLGVPVISCFTEIRDLETMDTEEFHDVQYILHVLDPLYPDPEKSDRLNSIEMAQKDYDQRREAYEKAYGKPLDYTFSYEDIAGYVPPQSAGS